MAPAPRSLLQESLWTNCVSSVENVAERSCDFQNPLERARWEKIRMQKGKDSGGCFGGPDAGPSLQAAFPYSLATSDFGSFFCSDRYIHSSVGWLSLTSLPLLILETRTSHSCSHSLPQNRCLKETQGMDVQV